MEFFEFVLVFSLVFVLPLTILRMVLEHKRARLNIGESERAESGVTAGELKRLLRGAVEDANAPLLARIDELEMHLQRPALADEFDDEDPLPEQERTLGRRVAD